VTQKHGQHHLTLEGASLPTNPPALIRKSKQTWYALFSIVDGRLSGRDGISRQTATSKEAVSSILRSLPTLATPIGIQPI
jgi:hypothetical protein